MDVQGDCMIDVPAGDIDVASGDLPFASMGDLGLVQAKRLTQCALSRICGVCGESLARPVAFLGSETEAERNEFHFPPTHPAVRRDGDRGVGGRRQCVARPPRPAGGTGCW